MNRLLTLFGILFVFFSCDNTSGYQIKGQLANAAGDTLFVVCESPGTIRIDTVVCNEKGRFFFFRENDEDLQVIMCYYNDRNQSFAVYPAAGKPVQVKGDAHFPQFLQIRGGRINDKLSEFKKSLHANLQSDLLEIIQAFISKNPKEEASAVLIAEFLSSPDELEQTERLLGLLSPELNDFYLVKNLWKEIEKARTTRVGAKAPAFKATNIYGQTYTADSLANKHFVLSFISNLSREMRYTEVMKFSDMVTAYPKDSLEVLLISLDDNPETLRETIRQDSIRWNFVADSAGQAIQLFEKYNVNALPKYFLIDKAGVIMLNTASGREVQQKIDEIMN